MLPVGERLLVFTVRPICALPPLSLCTAGAGPGEASVTQIFPWLLESKFQGLSSFGLWAHGGWNQELRPGQYRREFWAFSGVEQAFAPLCASVLVYRALNLLRPQEISRLAQDYLFTKLLWTALPSAGARASGSPSPTAPSFWRGQGRSLASWGDPDALRQHLEASGAEAGLEPQGPLDAREIATP